MKICRQLLLISTAITVLTACKPATSSSIKIKGSDTVLPIAQKLAELFAEKAPELEVSVTGGGSGVGIAALLENTTDIAMSSREMKFNEKLKLQDKALEFHKTTIAFDALAVCVNPKNPVKQLTREQIEGIFTGKILNWKEVGGPDERIVSYSRESSSGTHEFFKEVVLEKKEFAPNVLMMPATGAIIQSVSQTTGAIGYVGLAYLNPTVRALPLSYDHGKHYIAPNMANALSKTYPIVRPLFFIYLGSKQAKVQPFLDFAFSDAGQQAVKEIGFIPVPHRAAADSTAAPTTVSPSR